LRFNVLQHQVAPQEKAIAVGNSAYSGQATIYPVLALKHPTIQPGDDATACRRLDQYLVFTNLACMDGALIATDLQSFTVLQAGENIRFGETNLIHSLVKI
jgi:hypothetical protein